MNEVKVGQEYRCKRRGHTVRVVEAEGGFNAVVVNTVTGRKRIIQQARLLAPYRFEQLTNPSQHDLSERPEGDHVAHATEAAGA